MLLPNHAAAYVPEEKLIGYLLNTEHPIGGSKARLLARYGFTIANANVFAAALLSSAAQDQVSSRQQTPHGRKFIVDGELPTPRGTTLRIRSVWIIDRGATAPRLVPAYPR